MDNKGLSKAIIVGTACALALASGAALAAQGSKGGKERGQKGETIGVTSALVIVPLEIEAKVVETGCWAKMYSRNQYAGDAYTIVGPTSLTTVDGFFGASLGSLINSIEVGPAATLTVYDNEFYKDRNATFKPGAQVPDLDSKLGLFEEVASLKLVCTPPKR